MADIKPFMAYRPGEGLADKIAALPYDVYNRAEAAVEVKREPLSFLGIDRAETGFPETVDTYADCVYERAKQLLWDRIERGDWVKEDFACYYLYELIMDGRSQTGIVACSSIDDYCNGIIKKHENTRADKEVDRIRHVDTCDAQTGPIFLAYRDVETLRSVREMWKRDFSPVYDFTSEDGITHRVWVIDDEGVCAKIRSCFASIPEVYIADGHHRCASAAKVGLKRREEAGVNNPDAEYNYFLSVLFPDSELMIMDYNRVVKDLNGYTKAEFLEKITDSFEVWKLGKEQVKPSQKGEFGMYLDGEWYLLCARDKVKSTDPVKGLDVSVLQDYLLNPILGIADPKTDKRIDFVGGIRGLDELERRANSDMCIAFSMYPTSINELFEVADAGLLMPPKSTWFEPKLRSGLFIHSLR